MKKYTINDIAILCDVGKSTVSRVLNNAPNVKEETRLKIQKKIDEIGFQPNKSARAMRGIAEKTIGVIVTKLNSTAESQTLSIILQELYRQNMIPLIVESQFKSEIVKKHLKRFKQRQVDGVIIFTFSDLSSEIFLTWKNKIVSIVNKYPNIPSVSYDDENAIKLLMQYFYQKGYRHIGYLGVNSNDKTTGKKRTVSYQAFCKENDIDENIILGNFDAEDGYINSKQLLQKKTEAIVCAGSHLAIGALKFLQESNQSLPLGCVGKNELLEYLAPQVISLDFGYRQAGKWAVEILVNCLNGDEKIEHRVVPLTESSLDF